MGSLPLTPPGEPSTLLDKVNYTNRGSQTQVKHIRVSATMVGGPERYQFVGETTRTTLRPVTDLCSVIRTEAGEDLCRKKKE